jgi:hypothetical protein
MLKIEINNNYAIDDSLPCSSSGPEKDRKTRRPGCLGTGSSAGAELLPFAGHLSLAARSDDAQRSISMVASTMGSA